eukprot:CAMPEP_0201510156 /NCGR_PEP_ID=MMETSP0161_2-20130828/2964_1 /ASSEMBLY_ACC=CAM_ASM_000251 /TAXON_ID=180227 /ORGANISM="Neoparamoeba aestuarina, Strain SoJaBio B1-5/56/2" /LENGTH=321 /DNA_ID=CAMNT_0047905291 /DNA_START=119 /DNA_END=1084 /DNA_ORIENTATION=-
MMKSIWKQKDALRILVLPLRQRLDNHSCLFVALDDCKKKEKSDSRVAEFLDGKAKEFREMTYKASNLSQKDYDKALGWKQKMKVGSGLLTKQLNRTVTAEEMFFSSLPQTQPRAVQIIYPSFPSFSPHEIQSHLRSLAKEGRKNHSKWLYASLSGLPLSAGAVVLPGPNVIFLWNVFRCHSHWAAKLGAENLYAWMDKNHHKHTDSHNKHKHKHKHHHDDHDHNKHKHKHEHDHKHKHHDHDDDHKHHDNDHDHKHKEESHWVDGIEWRSSDRLMELIRDDPRGEWLSMDTIEDIQEELGDRFELITPYEKKVREFKEKKK